MITHPHQPLPPAVAPRLGFLSPRFQMAQLGDACPATWDTIAPVVPLTDLRGIAPTTRPVTVRLAWSTAGFLHLHAEGTDAKLTRKPEFPPGHPRFWTQDHLELWLLHADGQPLQVIATPDGQCWDNRDQWRTPDRLACRGTVDDNGWEMELRVPAAALGLVSLHAGLVLRGLVALAHWTGDETVDLAACSATELGFQQEERFAEFVLGDTPTTLPRLVAVDTADGSSVMLTLRNPGATDFAGHLALRCEQADDDEATSQRLPLAIAAGGSVALPAAWPRAARRFTRLCLAVEDAGGRHELAAPSLRAAPAPQPEPAVPLVHPYLYFDAAGLAAFRRKAALPAFATLASQLVPKPDDFDDRHLPPPGGQFPFDFEADSMNWGRVCRETLLRDGEKSQKTAAARIWNLLPAAAQAAVRSVAARDQATAEELAILVPAFNALLRRPDLAAGDAFANVRLPPEGRQLLERDPQALDSLELTKRNRILLQSAIECCGKFKVNLAGRAGGYLPKWLLSGEPRLVELATRTAQAAADCMIPEASFHLHEGNISPLLALAYDTFQPLLDEAQRGHWRRLLTKLLDLYLASARQGAWTVSAIPNANPVAGAGAGCLALALWNEEPAKAREALDWVRRYIWNWLDYCAGPDGGNTEGCQYWQYGTESWIRFAALYERIFGRDEGMLDHPALRHGMNMIRVALCNDGALHGVNDTVPVPCGIELAWFWAGRHADRFALWYGDHAQRWQTAAAAAGRPTAYHVSPLWGILFRPDQPGQLDQPEPLPQAFALRSIEYGILRSGPNWDCRWTAGLKGSRPPYTHHNQADTGALFVDLRGERLLIDPGYYKPEATDHCLPIIDGVGPKQPSRHVGTITVCREQDGWRHLACDATAAYGGVALRVVRHLVMLGDQALLLLDDIVPANPTATVRAQYQCGGGPTLMAGGRALDVAGAAARLRLSWPTHPKAQPNLAPERSLHDTHWGYHFARCRLFPVTLDYPPQANRPLLALFQDATDGPPPPIQIDATDERIGIALPSGRTLRFLRLESGWTL